MPIHVDAYTGEGMASGALARPGHLRDVLETQPTLDLEGTQWRSLGGPATRGAATLSIPIDDVLIASAEGDLTTAVHASWHAIELEIGPYLVRGELPTLPGFDPGRALTRPGGEFVVLRDVRVSLLGEPAAELTAGQLAQVNRYGVERVLADIMLGFFFPGAELGAAEADRT